MKSSLSRFPLFYLTSLLTILLFNFSPLNAADGKKWDGKAYPFKLLDPSKPNSESNPVIISTAGQLAYMNKIGNSNLDIEAFGKKNGLIGLRPGFVGNYVKLTSDLDLNGTKYGWSPIQGGGVMFDGGGHVITNMRISEKTAKSDIQEDMGVVETNLALFKDAGVIKNLGIGKGSSVSFIYSKLGSVYKGKHLALKVFVAALVVEADEIHNCYSEATVTVKGNDSKNVGKVDGFVGGLAVTCSYKITNSSNRGTVSFEGHVIDSHVENGGGGEHPGRLQVAGLCATPASRVGAMQKHPGVFNSYNTGSITVKASGHRIDVGGVAAEIENIECVSIYNTGNVNFTAIGNIRTAYVGGVLGNGITSPTRKQLEFPEKDPMYNKGNINASLMTGRDIHVGGISGGVVGSGGGNPSFSSNTYKFGGVYGFINSYNTGSVSVSSTGKVDAIDAGGIVGWGCMVINSYNTGNISGNSSEGTKLLLGGLGGSGVYIQNSYSIGAMSCKGTGTNIVGGILGEASVRWGETDNTLYVVLNGFWLKETKESGINSDVQYAKGSYYYMKKSDMKKNTLDKALDLMDKLDSKKNASGDEMVEENHYGTVYSFDSPTSSVMKRTDDGPAKRKDINSTLLQALNDIAQQRQDRNYFKWKIDSLNNGYPVFDVAK